MNISEMADKINAIPVTMNTQKYPSAPRIAAPTMGPRIPVALMEKLSLAFACTSSSFLTKLGIEAEMAGPKTTPTQG